MKYTKQFFMVLAVAMATGQMNASSASFRWIRPGVVAPVTPAVIDVAAKATAKTGMLSKAANGLRSATSSVASHPYIAGAVAFAGLGISLGTYFAQPLYTSNVHKMSIKRLTKLEEELIKLANSDDFKDEKTVQEAVTRLKANTYIHKPFAIQDLRIALKNVMTVKATLAANKEILDLAGTDTFKSNEAVKALLVKYAAAEGLDAQTAVVAELAKIVKPASYKDYLTLRNIVIAIGATGVVIAGVYFRAPIWTGIKSAAKTVGGFVKANPKTAAGIVLGTAAATTAVVVGVKRYNANASDVIVLSTGTKVQLIKSATDKWIVPTTSLKSVKEAEYAELVTAMLERNIKCSLEATQDGTSLKMSRAYHASKKATPATAEQQRDAALALVKDAEVSLPVNSGNHTSEPTVVRAQ